MGFSLAEGSVNGECVAEFFDVPTGKYHVSISGTDVTNADDGNVEVNSVVTESLEVPERHSEAADSIKRAASTSFVSVADLRVPSNAAKKFEEASRFIAKKEWAKAIERLQKGLTLCPKYAPAYNNLGAVYSHQGDNARARAALQTAVALDDHLAPAYVNLGRLSFLENDLPAAESLLTKATSLAPATNADELLLLAYAALSNHHLEQAIYTSAQGHAERMSQHAFLHLVAANAFEQQGKITDSMSQLRLYLREEPIGPRAEKARRVLESFEDQTAAR